MIKKLCYELYKLDWKYSNVPTGVEMDSIKDYYQKFVADDTNYTYNDYLNEFGYYGQLYATYEEFLKNEYLNKEYIYSLLFGNKELFTMYLKDINNQK